MPSAGSLESVWVGKVPTGPSSCASFPFTAITVGPGPFEPPVRGTVPVETSVQPEAGRKPGASPAELEADVTGKVEPRKNAPTPTSTTTEASGKIARRGDRRGARPGCRDASV